MPGWDWRVWLGNKIALVTLLLAGVGLGLIILNAGRRSPERVASPLPVQVTRLEPVASYLVTRFYTGEVVATRRSELGFERGGMVVAIAYDRGQRVLAGAVVARLDTQNLQAELAQLQAERLRAIAQLQELQTGPRREVMAAARSEVANLENQLRLENLRRERRRSLYEEGAISREQLDEVSFNRDALAERLAAARSRWEELANGTRPEVIAAQKATVAQIEASINNVQITIAKSLLRAPFAGVVGERRVDEGTVVQAGQGILRLVEQTQPEVEIGVPPQVAARLTLGSSQTVQVGQRTYAARLIALQPETEPQTRTRTVVLQLQGTELGLPAPGEIARLSVTQTVAMSGYWLPVMALAKGERGLWSVLVLGENNRVQRRDVEVLHTDGERVLVRGTVSPGESVVSQGMHRLVGGQVVQPK
ncbi:RND family efflux transporter MFP subunit [Gloeomargarita lithophora Alchichica-D10]|uniref:RND family efflux transporter MFP subunit n=2 Tax=Gloeomargarita TaxID=1188227 RepID=A0A1J0AGX2_9CYAN|nr:RND family efflux transporter MFP subunit [Gloeomargarita lithophora Alchichica-D10]